MAGTAWSGEGLGELSPGGATLSAVYGNAAVIGWSSSSCPPRALEVRRAKNAITVHVRYHSLPRDASPAVTSGSGSIEKLRPFLVRRR